MQRTTCSALGSVQCTTTWCTWGCTCTGPCIDCPPCGQDTQTGRGCFRLHFLAAVSWCRRIYRRPILHQNGSDELQSNHIWMPIGSPTQKNIFYFLGFEESLGWGSLEHPLQVNETPLTPILSLKNSRGWVPSHHITDRGGHAAPVCCLLGGSLRLRQVCWGWWAFIHSCDRLFPNLNLLSIWCWCQNMLKQISALYRKKCLIHWMGVKVYQSSYIIKLQKCIEPCPARWTQV